MTTIIHTPTPNLAASISFYEKLNFKKHTSDTSTFFSDGNVILEINESRYARAGVKFFKNDWSAEVAQLEKITSVTSLENGFLASDPNGIWVYLVKGDFQNLPTAPDVKSLLGNFAGLSFEATDVKRSVEFWSIFGYQKTMGSIEQGWIAFSNDSPVGISIMKPNACPHLFFNPSCTYFNGKNNLEVIQNIRATSIPITEEITAFNAEGLADNVIIRDPGGYGFFIFSD